MFVSALPFDGAPAQRQRAVGRISFAATAFDGRTRPMRIEESGSMRIRLPKGDGAGLDAVLVNTAGGIACGDRFAVEVEAQAGTFVTVATPAAEKVYRSDGPVSHLSVKLAAGARARLDWLPQETILFDNARLDRQLEAAIAEDARLTLIEPKAVLDLACHISSPLFLPPQQWLFLMVPVSKGNPTHRRFRSTQCLRANYDAQASSNFLLRPYGHKVSFHHNA